MDDDGTHHIDYKFLGIPEKFINLWFKPRPGPDSALREEAKKQLEHFRQYFTHPLGALEVPQVQIQAWKLADEQRAKKTRLVGCPAIVRLGPLPSDPRWFEASRLPRHYLAAAMPVHNRKFWTTADMWKLTGKGEGAAQGCRMTTTTKKYGDTFWEVSAVEPGRYQHVPERLLGEDFRECNRLNRGRQPMWGPGELFVIWAKPGVIVPPPRKHPDVSEWVTAQERLVWNGIEDSNHAVVAVRCNDGGLEWHCGTKSWSDDALNSILAAFGAEIVPHYAGETRLPQRFKFSAPVIIPEDWQEPGKNVGPVEAKRRHPAQQSLAKREVLTSLATVWLGCYFDQTDNYSPLSH